MTAAPETRSNSVSSGIPALAQDLKNAELLASGLSALADRIETGTVRQKDAEHWWIYQAVDGRSDNLVCAAVLSRQALIVKTPMTHWEEPDAGRGGTTVTTPDL